MRCFYLVLGNGVAETIKLITNESDSNSRKRLMISYCWADCDISHALADTFVKEKFNIWIDREKMCKDVFFAMDMSDIIFIYKQIISKLQ